MDNSYLMIDSNLNISINKEKFKLEKNPNKLNQLTNLISKSELYKNIIKMNVFICINSFFFRDLYLFCMHLFIYWNTKKHLIKSVF